MILSTALDGAKRLARLLPGGPSFATSDVVIGRNVTFGQNVVFTSKRVRIGDGVRIGDDVRVEAEVFEMGDYGTIYDRCFFPGPGEIRIGHNFWIGIGAIVDGMAGTTIRNNVCVGAQSQLWTHMVFGDVMAGCRFNNRRPLLIDDDAWLSGHCLVSPVTVGARSLAMLGSVITRDMAPDHTYAGVPATDVTERVGPQFTRTSIEFRIQYMRDRIEGFSASHPRKILDRVAVVTTADELKAVPEDVLAFNVGDRTYTKGRAEFEHSLMRHLLPEAKFVPAVIERTDSDG